MGAKASPRGVYLGDLDWMQSSFYKSDPQPIVSRSCSKDRAIRQFYLRSAVVLLSGLLSLAGAAPALAGATGFILVNATGSDIVGLSVRRFGTQQWQPLAGSPSVGARQAISFADPDCAFDIRATLSGGVSATWAGVNLCEVKSVILNRDSASGATWADYD